MATEFIGRKKEKEVLQKALESGEAEMVLVIGRRRIGKTYLIKTFYKEHIVFEITGIKNANTELQLQNFAGTLQKQLGNGLKVEQPKNWVAAFFELSDYLETRAIEQKYVVFLDELPWLAVSQPGFIAALGWFWNSWAVNQNIVVVI